MINKQLNKIDIDINDKYKILMKQKEDNCNAVSNLIKALSMNVNETVISAINVQIENLTNQNNSIDIEIKNVLDSNLEKSDYEMNLKNIKNALDLIKKDFNNYSIEIKRDLIRKIIDKIIWDGEAANIFIQGNIKK